MFGGRDEASLVDGKGDEEEKGGHDIPCDDLYEEEFFEDTQPYRIKETQPRGL